MNTIRTPLAESRFVQAAFNSAARPKLLSDLQNDPFLREAAKEKLEALKALQESSRLLDRDHISRTVHHMLSQMLVQAELGKNDNAGISIG